MGQRRQGQPGSRLHVQFGLKKIHLNGLASENQEQNWAGATVGLGHAHEPLGLPLSPSEHILKV